MYTWTLAVIDVFRGLFISATVWAYIYPYIIEMVAFIVSISDCILRPVRGSTATCLRL